MDKGNGQIEALRSIWEGEKINSALLDAFVAGGRVNFNEDCDFHEEDDTSTTMTMTTTTTTSFLTQQPTLWFYSNNLLSETRRR